MEKQKPTLKMRKEFTPQISMEMILNISDTKNPFKVPLLKFIEEISEHLIVKTDEVYDWIGAVLSNVDFYQEGDWRNNTTSIAIIDIYDWNDILLFSSMANYTISNVEPKELFDDEYFGKYNLEQFDLFKNGKHRYFTIKNI